LTATINSLVLAYLGDSIYENRIREALVKTGINNVNSLQKEAVKYVSATAQSKILKDLIEKDFFSEQELTVVKRGRNHKSTHKPKNTDIVTYKYATGFETLIGYLYLENKTDRIDEMMKEII
jgi:ribonuclease-3 family protein